ncbi:flagellar export protein FliJ [Wolinella succinogenes]|uniref:Uncharacterized protein n=1 Tax=Wolinella succinogenes (strain ATCC 29543 / DSM 1740 / CCUG 13145 / JCM 31913 / LMG 7466 / NCTC 11488 / FDC 602W) TaxID=273121 RepID=Q7MQS1_WOLSU|nr:flagellar export protein FliJ [Wolinella succinogenes]NLU33599.1 FliJ family protein [Wolinella succinogenes]CAE11055.1 hypothetical protein WS2055 [Wolinella succinogenes]VEG81220.1 Uncharacterised protein [Wolinella succinogenes]HCZ19114.1 hypothetical protein [Helicobacter sp.]
MKTKFTQFLRIKKEALNEAERAILVVNREIEQMQEEIASILREIASIAIPSSGAYADFLKIQAIKKAHIDELEFKKLDLAHLREKRQRMQEQLKLLSLEHEKAKYLDKLEIQKMLALQKRQEELQMDEVSLLLYNTRNGSSQFKEEA